MRATLLWVLSLTYLQGIEPTQKSPAILVVQQLFDLLGFPIRLRGADTLGLLS